jgi:FAD/FMN-containing dehydrogenase
MVQEAVRDALVSGGFSIEDILFAENANRAPVYNLRVPVTPLVLLFPRSSQHVSAAVKVAKSFGLKIQARSGGHSHASYSLGGADGHMIVDMKYLKDLHIDKETWRATVGPGLRLDELAWTLHDNVGRMIPQGTCGSVCVGGM